MSIESQRKKVLMTLVVQGPTLAKWFSNNGYGNTIKSMLDDGEIKTGCIVINSASGFPTNKNVYEITEKGKDVLRSLLGEKANG